MNRTLVMTVGFLLVFFGIQLNVVDSYVLTPRMANFVSEQLPETQNFDNRIVANPQTGQIAQVGYSSSETAALSFPTAPKINRVIRPPGWLGWPIMFLGAVFFLNGLAIRR